MRIPSGVTDQVIYFVAVDATDFTTRETGLSGFTVTRARNGGTAAAMTTPTVTEVDATNMPGVYALTLDEDMTIGAGNDSEEMAFHITATGMAPVTRTIELYRLKITAGATLSVESDGDLTKVNTLDGHTAQTGDSYARIGAPAGASVSADVAAIKAETAAILDDTDLIDDATSGLAKIATDVAAVLVDTGTTLPAQVGAPAGASIAADIAAVKAETASILADTGTDLPATLATIAGYIDTEVAAIKAKTDALPSDPADQSLIIAATDAIVSAVGTVDTVVDAIKAVTDALPDAGALTSLATAAALATVDSNVDAILTDTGTTLPATLAAQDTAISDLPTNAELATALAAADDAVLAAIDALENLSAAEVNAEVLDVLATDTFAEPSGVPSTTATLADKLGALHMMMVNKVTVTASKKQFFDAAGNAEFEKDLSDDGTTYTETAANAI